MRWWHTEHASPACPCCARESPRGHGPLASLGGRPCSLPERRLRDPSTVGPTRAGAGQPGLWAYKLGPGPGIVWGFRACGSCCFRGARSPPQLLVAMAPAAIPSCCCQAGVRLQGTTSWGAVVPRSLFGLPEGPVPGGCSVWCGGRGTREACGAGSPGSPEAGVQDDLPLAALSEVLLMPLPQGWQDPHLHLQVGADEAWWGQRAVRSCLAVLGTALGTGLRPPGQLSDAQPASFSVPFCRVPEPVPTPASLSTPCSAHPSRALAVHGSPARPALPAARSSSAPASGRPSSEAAPATRSTPHPPPAPTALLGFLQDTFPQDLLTAVPACCLASSAWPPSSCSPGA